MNNRCFYFPTIVELTDATPTSFNTDDIAMIVMDDITVYVLRNSPGAIHSLPDVIVPTTPYPDGDWWWELIEYDPDVVFWCGNLEGTAVGAQNVVIEHAEDPDNARFVDISFGTPTNQLSVETNVSTEFYLETGISSFLFGDVATYDHTKEKNCTLDTGLLQAKELSASLFQTISTPSGYQDVNRGFGYKVAVDQVGESWLVVVAELWVSGTGRVAFIYEKQGDKTWLHVQTVTETSDASRNSSLTVNTDWGCSVSIGVNGAAGLLAFGTDSNFIDLFEYNGSTFSHSAFVEISGSAALGHKGVIVNAVNRRIYACDHLYYDSGVSREVGGLYDIKWVDPDWVLGALLADTTSQFYRSHQSIDYSQGFNWIITGLPQHDDNAGVGGSDRGRGHSYVINGTDGHLTFGYYLQGLPGLKLGENVCGYTGAIVVHSAVTKGFHPQCESTTSRYVPGDQNTYAHWYGSANFANELTGRFGSYQIAATLHNTLGADDCVLLFRTRYNYPVKPTYQARFDNPHAGANDFFGSSGLESYDDYIVVCSSGMDNITTGDGVVDILHITEAVNYSSEFIICRFGGDVGYSLGVLAEIVKLGIFGYESHEDEIRFLIKEVGGSEYLKIDTTSKKLVVVSGNAETAIQNGNQPTFFLENFTKAFFSSPERAEKHYNILVGVSAGLNETPFYFSEFDVDVGEFPIQYRAWREDLRNIEITLLSATETKIENINAAALQVGIKIFIP